MLSYSIDWDPLTHPTGLCFPDPKTEARSSRDRAYETSLPGTEPAPEPSAWSTTLFATLLFILHWTLRRGTVVSLSPVSSPDLSFGLPNSSPNSLTELGAVKPRLVKRLLWAYSVPGASNPMVSKTITRPCPQGAYRAAKRTTLKM